MDTTRPYRKRYEYLEQRSEKKKRNMDSRIQVQLKEDRGGSVRQSWIETSGLWHIVPWEQQGIRQVTPHF